MLVHITLNLKEDEVDARRESVLEALHRAGLREVDTKFLKRYSLLSGRVDRKHLHDVARLPMVEAVELDAEVVAF